MNKQETPSIEQQNNNKNEEEQFNCCLRNATPTQPWHKTEYQNLNDLSDWVGCAYIFADVNIGVLYETLSSGYDLETDCDLNKDVHQLFYGENKQVSC